MLYPQNPLRAKAMSKKLDVTSSCSAYGGETKTRRQNTPQPRQNPLFIISVTLKYIPSLIPREDKCLFKGGGEVGSGSQHIKKKIKKNQTKPTPQNKTDFIASDQSS